VFSERPSHRGNVAVARRLQRFAGRHQAAARCSRSTGSWTTFRTATRSCSSTGSWSSRRSGASSPCKNVTINEPFFEGHFPGHAIMPGVLIVEGMAQAGGLLLMNGSRTIDEGRLLHGARRRAVPPAGEPGDTLEFEVELVQHRKNVFRMRGVSRVDGKVVAEGSMMAQLVDR
jgi:3-hydroxyacyl-[acyl-carrier-protein] dehydratase